MRKLSATDSLKLGLKSKEAAGSADTKAAIEKMEAQLKGDPDGYPAVLERQTKLAKDRADYIESHGLSVNELNDRDVAAMTLAHAASRGVPPAGAVASFMVLNSAPPDGAA